MVRSAQHSMYDGEGNLNQIAADGGGRLDQIDAVKNVAGWITPVPGGVGPMTIAMLLENCLRAASRELGSQPPT